MNASKIICRIAVAGSCAVVLLAVAACGASTARSSGGDGDRGVTAETTGDPEPGPVPSYPDDGVTFNLEEQPTATIDGEQSPPVEDAEGK